MFPTFESLSKIVEVGVEIFEPPVQLPVYWKTLKKSLLILSKQRNNNKFNILTVYIDIYVCLR